MQSTKVCKYTVFSENILEGIVAGGMVVLKYNWITTYIQKKETRFPKFLFLKSFLQ